MTRRLAFIHTRVKEIAAYRLEFFLGLATPLLQMLLLSTVWRAVYAGRASLDGVSLKAMTTYVSISAMHSLLIRDKTDRWVERRVRTGVIAMDLLRPMRLWEQALWGSVAQIITQLPIIVLIIPIAAAVSGITPPTQPGHYALSAVLGVLVNTGLMLLLSSITFWTLELGGLNFLFFTVYSFANGALVPLWFMPEWLATVLSYLPFQATIYTPVAIYVGQTRGTAAWQAIGVQALWLLVITALMMIVWNQAVRRVVVQGG